MSSEAAKTKVKKDKPVSPILTTVKAFDKDLKCRGHQYEIGETYSIKGAVVACENGFHACENPLDVLNYYPLHGSRFAVVEQSGEIDRRGDDTKVASATITIKAELRIPDFIKRAVAWIVENAKDAATTGNYANAATTGGCANAATTGYSANAATTGNYANAATTGGCANAATTGGCANAATTGNRANAATTGNYANAATTGECANAATTGECANAATTGECANAATTGYSANAATTGYSANAATTGNRANAATTGECANAATTGNYANAATTGNSAVASALGIEAKAKAGAGGAICIVNRDPYTGKLLAIRASKVGENGIKPDVWYALSADGQFVEVEGL